MIVFRNQENRKRLENHEKSGKIIRLMPGVYSTDLSSDHAIQVRLYFLKILTYLRPGSIISHRSAIKQDFGIADGVIIVTDPGINDNYVHDLPGLKILVSPGHKRLGKFRVQEKPPNTKFLHCSNQRTSFPSINPPTLLLN